MATVWGDALRQVVDRWGHFRFGLTTAVIWALPLAAWAGGADLSGTGDAPWIALRIGLVALAAWVVLVAWASRIHVQRRPRRLDVHAMTRTERLSWLLFAGAATVVVGWLNAAATVDWTLLARPLREGRSTAWGFVAAAAAVLVAALTAALGSWLAARREWLSRRG